MHSILYYISCWYGSETEKRPKIRFLQYWRYYIVICYESFFIGKIQLLVQMQEMPIIIYGRSNYDGKTNWRYMNLVEWIMQVRLAPIVNQHLQIELWEEVEKKGSIFHIANEIEIVTEAFHLDGAQSVVSFVFIEISYEQRHFDRNWF